MFPLQLLTTQPQEAGVNGPGSRVCQTLGKPSRWSWHCEHWGWKNMGDLSPMFLPLSAIPPAISINQSLKKCSHETWKLPWKIKSKLRTTNLNWMWIFHLKSLFEILQSKALCSEKKLPTHESSHLFPDLWVTPRAKPNPRTSSGPVSFRDTISTVQWHTYPHVQGRTKMKIWHAYQ